MNLRELFDKVIPNKRLTGNILILALAYAGNYATPLIAIPILTSRIGMENYGIVALCQGVMMLLVAFSDFGISFTGVKEISQTKDDQKAQNKYVSIILTCKIVLTISAFGILLVLLHFVEEWDGYFHIMLSSFLLVLGHSFFPKWLYEGKQKMAAVAVMNLTSRITYIFSLIILIQKPEDVLLVNALNGASWILVSLIGWIVGSIAFNIRPVLVSAANCIHYLQNNFSIFISTIVDTGFRNTGVIIGSFLLIPIELGFYSVLDKVILLLRGTFSFVYSALYPEVCSIVKEGSTSLNSFFKIALKPVAILVLFGSFGIYFFAAPLIATVISDISVQAIQNAIRLIALLPFLILINLPIGLTLLATGMNKQYFLYNLVIFCSFILLALALGNFFGKIGLVLAYLCIELIASIYGYPKLLAAGWISPKW